MNSLRDQFPILSKPIHGQPLVYLDNAATCQKPKRVVDAVTAYYEESCANIHRGVHYLSEKASKQYEDTRHKVQNMIGAKRVEEIVFTKGTTESINLIASTYGRQNIQSGDEILVSEMEHHSNIVPWQVLCEEKGAKLRVIPMDDEGQFIWDAFEKLLSEKTKIVAVSHISNALGTVLPLKAIVEKSHAFGAVVVVDGAQAVPHMPVNVTDLGCDFYTFSGHKMYGPTGVGVLYGKYDLLDQMPPYQVGGGMIDTVTFEKTTFAKSPLKFEAGTPMIASVIGLGEAISFMAEVGIENIAATEASLLSYAEEKLSQIGGLRKIGTAKEKAAVLSFVMEGIHPHDVSSILDRQGIAIRAGHLCAQPVMQHFKVPALCRASFAVYNLKSEVDALAKGLCKVKEVFHVR